MVDDGSASRFGRVKIQFCAGCDRPVSRIVGVPVPTVPHQRLPAPHNVTDDFVYRGGGFRVPSRQQRAAAHEDGMRTWDTHSSPSRPRSANYNRVARKSLRRTESSQDHPTHNRPAQRAAEGWGDDRPSTAPDGGAPAPRRNGSRQRSTRTPQPSHSAALSHSQGQPRRSMAALSRPQTRDAEF